MTRDLRALFLQVIAVILLGKKHVRVEIGEENNQDEEH